MLSFGMSQCSAHKEAFGKGWDRDLLHCCKRAENSPSFGKPLPEQVGSVPFTMPILRYGKGRNVFVFHLAEKAHI